MKIFVTGGTGFIGQAMIKRLLKDGWQVTALARSKKKKTKTIGSKKIKWVFGDIRDNCWHQYVVGCKAFIYLVGVHGHKKMPYQERITVELGGTQSAVIAAKQVDVSHFVYIGTAYDQMKTEYARAKNLARQWLEKQIKQGFPATIVCPVTVYGPGDKANLHRLFRAVKLGKFVFIGDGKNSWQLIYIDDLINGLMLILRNQKKVLKKTLVLTGSQSVTLKKLISLIAKKEGVSVPKIHLPKMPMLLLGRLFSSIAKLRIKGPFTWDTVVTITKTQKHFNSKILKNLGFKARIKLSEGIAKTIAWYQKKGYCDCSVED